MTTAASEGVGEHGNAFVFAPAPVSALTASVTPGSFRSE